MKALASNGQVKAIHALKHRIGLDEDDYRAALGQLGVASSKELSKADAIAFIDRLQKSAPPQAKGALKLSGPYAKVCRALWLSAWNLGLINDRTDKALAAFVKRQTGIDSLNWVRDQGDGAKAIEGLKAWIARPVEKGGGAVQWPTESQARRAGIAIARARKLAVIAAQKAILGVADQPNPINTTDADLDEAMQAFGRSIRAMKEARDGRL